MIYHIQPASSALYPYAPAFVHTFHKALQFDVGKNSPKFVNSQAFSIGLHLIFDSIELSQAFPLFTRPFLFGTFEWNENSSIFRLMADNT